MSAPMPDGVSSWQVHMQNVPSCTPMSRREAISAELLREEEYLTLADVLAIAVATRLGIFALIVLRRQSMCGSSRA